MSCVARLIEVMASMALGGPAPGSAGARSEFIVVSFRHRVLARRYHSHMRRVCWLQELGKNVEQRPRLRGIRNHGKVAVMGRRRGIGLVLSALLVLEQTFTFA